MNAETTTQNSQSATRGSRPTTPSAQSDPTPLATANSVPEPAQITIREALNILDYGQMNDLFRAMFPGENTNILLLTLSRTKDAEKALEAMEAYHTFCRRWKPRFLMQEAFRHPDSPVRFE